MDRSHQFQALMAIDSRSVSRDSMLRWMVVIPLVLALIVRYSVPAISDAVAERFAFDLAPHYPLILSFMVLLAPQFLGLVLGFLLLDQRDDRTLEALQVTPLSPRRLLAFRLAVPMVISIVTTILVFLLAGVLPFALPAVLGGALAGALFAPCYALVLASFASNKVMGFALAKGAGLVTMPPLVAWFVPQPWEFAFGLLPTYWPMKAYWVLQAGHPHGWVYVLIAAAYFLLLLAWLIRRFDRVLRS